MRQPSWENLIDLLMQNAAAEGVQQCLQAMRDEDSVGLLPSNRVSTKELLDIYILRAEMDNEDPDPSDHVEGCERLIAALSSETEARICFYLVALKNVWYAIHTSVDTSKLIGIQIDSSERPPVFAKEYAEGRVPGANEAHKTKCIADQAQLRMARKEKLT